jgi:hypothetical protein
MAIYSGIDDVPPTPKSPPLTSSTPSTGVKLGNIPDGDSKFEEIQLRWREEQQVGVDGALYSATQRLKAKSSPSNQIDSILGRLKNVPSQAQQSAHGSTTGQHVSGGTDTNVPLTMGQVVAERVIAWLRSEQAKRWQDPNPPSIDFSVVYRYNDPLVQASGTIVEAVVKNLSHKPYPATAPPEWLQGDEERVREWWLGHNRESAARLAKADQERARAEAEANALRAVATASGQNQGSSHDWTSYYAQQQSYAPYMAILQQLNGGQQQNAQPTQVAQPSGQQSQIPESQLQSILAAMNQAQQPPAQASAQGGAGILNPNDPSYQQYLRLAQMAQGQYPQNATNDHDADRNDRSDRNDRDDYGWGDSYGRGKDNKKKKPGPSTVHKPANVALIGTKPCTFWQAGKCARGDKCTFRHD